MASMGMRKPLRNRNQPLIHTNLNVKKKRRTVDKPAWDVCSLFI